MTDTVATAGGGRFLRGHPPRRLLSRRTLVLLGAAIGLLLLLLPLAGENGLPAYFRLRAETRRLEARVEALRREASALESRLQELRDDPEALERVARERYLMHAPGERVYEVVTPPEP